MVAIREARRYVFVSAAALLLIDLVCLGILVSPWGRSRTHLQGRLSNFQTELQTKVRQVGPSRGMDEKLKTVSATTRDFYDQRLPQLYSEIDDALGAAEKESGVHMGDVRYGTQAQANKEEIPIPEGLRKVNIVLTISGQYVEDVRFINALERSKVFFVIQSVSLAGEQGREQTTGRTGTNVTLQLGVETYLRRGAA